MLLILDAHKNVVGPLCKASNLLRGLPGWDKGDLDNPLIGHPLRAEKEPTFIAGRDHHPAPSEDEWSHQTVVRRLRHRFSPTVNRQKPTLHHGNGPRTPQRPLWDRSR